jgi:hypothetical protein
MIFSHMQKPLGMRETRMGKRISVHRVPLDTTWFCPYCCATVDTPLFTQLSDRASWTAVGCGAGSYKSVFMSLCASYRFVDLL